MRSNRLTTLIFIGMILGIVVGYLCSITWPDPQTAKEIAGYISLISDVFLRLIKMIIAPLVFSTLVVGIAHMGDTASVGRVGGKALLWFVGASFCSLLLGLVMVNLLRPGDALNLPLPDAGASTNLKAASLSLKEFVTHLVPKSAVEAMANNEILQIVVFSVFFGVGLAALGEKGRFLAQGIEGLAEVMLKVTGYVMNFARAKPTKSGTPREGRRLATATRPSVPFGSTAALRRASRRASQRRWATRRAKAAAQKAATRPQRGVRSRALVWLRSVR